MQLGIGDALPGNMAHSLERRAPIRAAHIHKHSVHVEDQDLRPQRLFHCAEIHLELRAFPSARKECTRKPGKNVKSRISRWPRREDSNGNELQEAQRDGKESQKEPHPADGPAFCSSVMQGAAGGKISWPR